MAGSKQSKRVSWAPGVTLCQVRLFLSEDAPAQSALGSQDHLQAKVAWLLHSTTAATSDDSVPPGFETLHRGQIQRNIPLIKWHCPPIQCLEPEWLVVAGEESLEVALQDRRQLGVLEAIYPRLSSIPPDPCVSPDVQLALFDDSQTLLIPIVAVEDDDTAEQDTAAPSTTVSSYFITPLTAAPEHSLPLPSSIPPVQQLPSAAASSSLGPGASAKPDIAAAASAAFTAIMRSNEEGSLIDRDLLIKILRDPSMVGKLVSEHSARKQTPLPTQPAPPIASGPTNTAYPMPNLIPTPAPSLKPPPPPSSTTIPINIPTPTVLPKVPLAKDVNYYKSLIQKHGGDRQEPAEPAPLPYENRHEYRNKPLEFIYGGGAGREMRRSEGRKPRTEKPCAYFNTPRGCRQGSSCSYLHDSSAPRKMERQRGSKRIKFDR